MSSFRFAKIKRGNDGEVTQNQLYVTFDQFCQCNCPGCRNKELPAEEMDANRRALERVIMKNAEKFRHIIFGGGEPLYQIDQIVSLINKIRRRDNPIYKIIQRFEETEDESIKFSITTNGEKRIFLNKINGNCPVCQTFDRIILSRYHDDDATNDRLFVANGTLMTTQDISLLCKALKGKIQLSCLCQKGGIENTEDVLRYIDWAENLQIKSIMFSNYQQDVTPAEAKQIDGNSETLRQVQARLVESYDYHLVDTFVLSAGCKVSVYRRIVPIRPIEQLALRFEIALITGITDNDFLNEVVEVAEREDDIVISFREFLTPEELAAEWKTAKKRTYNYSVMPSGAMYADWSCKNLI